MMVSGFFEDEGTFTGPPLDESKLIEAETALGFRLPDTYVELLRERNGGSPIARCFPTDFANSWASDHIEILAIRGVGGEWGIDSTSGLGSRDMVSEWGYPDIGIVICEMPSGGHDSVMLDYSTCGPQGVPSVVYIDEDRVPREIAPTFEAFIAGLLPCSDLAPSQ